MDRRASPTAFADVATAAIGALARRAVTHDIALHTIQVSIRGETVTHAVSDPFDLDTPQRMYSVSKTVTGLAIGLLADEGLLSLDDVGHVLVEPPVQTLGDLQEPQVGGLVRVGADHPDRDHPCLAAEPVSELTEAID